MYLVRIHLIFISLVASNLHNVFSISPVQNNSSGGKQSVPQKKPSKKIIKHKAIAATIEEPVSKKKLKVKIPSVKKQPSGKKQSQQPSPKLLLLPKPDQQTIEKSSEAISLKNVSILLSTLKSKLTELLMITKNLTVSQKQPLQKRPQPKVPSQKQEKEASSLYQQTGSNVPPPPLPPVFTKEAQKITEKKPLSTGLLGDIQKGAQLKKVDLTVVKKEDIQTSLQKVLGERRQVIADEGDTNTLSLAQLEKEAQIQEQKKITQYRESHVNFKNLSDKEIKEKIAEDEKIKIEEKNKQKQEKQEKILLDEKVRQFRKANTRNYTRQQLADDDFVIKKVKEKEEKTKKEEQDLQKKIEQQKQKLGGGSDFNLVEKIRQQELEKEKNLTEKQRIELEKQRQEEEKEWME